MSGVYWDLTSTNIEAIAGRIADVKSRDILYPINTNMDNVSCKGLHSWTATAHLTYDDVMSSKLPCLPHHEIEVGVCVYGGANPSIVVFKIVHGNLKANLMA